MYPLIRPLIGEIDETEARKMIAAYDADNTGVTKSVWFSLEQINQLTTLLNAEKLLQRGTDGVRIYFARYTPETISNMPADYVGRNTVVFVSTVENNMTGETIHEDYFDGIILPAPAVPENRGELCQPNCKGTRLP